MYFICYKTEAGKDMCVRFYTVDSTFEWLQEWKNSKGGYPSSLLIAKGECIFDGS